MSSRLQVLVERRLHKRNLLAFRHESQREVNREINRLVKAILKEDTRTIPAPQGLPDQLSLGLG